MDTCSFHTPPNQVKKTYNTPDNAQANLENLIKLHQMGVITLFLFTESVYYPYYLFNNDPLYFLKVILMTNDIMK